MRIVARGRPDSRSCLGARSLRAFRKQPALAVLLAALCLSAVGCFSYAIVMTVQAGQGHEDVRSDAAVAAAAAALGQVAGQFGMQPNPDLAELRRSSQVSDEYEDIVIANYETGTDWRTHGRVGVSLLAGKATDRLSVLIRDFDSFGPSDYTRQLERSIHRALVRALPASRIEVRRQHVGPELGP